MRIPYTGRCLGLLAIVSLYSIGVKAQTVRATTNKITLGQAKSQSTAFPRETTIAKIEIDKSSTSFIDGNGDKTINAEETCSIRFDIMNVGKGVSGNLKVIVIEKNGVVGLGYPKTPINISSLASEDVQNIRIPVVAGNDLATDSADFEILVEQPGNPNPPSLRFKVATQASQKPGLPLMADVDQELPKTRMTNPDAIAVVIGNKNYEHTSEVRYAINDSRSMRRYLIEVMGFKEGNVLYKEDAKGSDFQSLFGNSNSFKGRLFNAVKPGLSDVFIFYAGHGAPDFSDFKGYFVPVDCHSNEIALNGYPVETFYKNLEKIPARSITVVLDACFSGAGIFKSISSAGIKSEDIDDIRNGTLISSSDGAQVSGWYPEMGHGLFTYFFLKAIQDKTRSDKNRDNALTLQEIYEYVSDQAQGVPYFSRRLHNIEQTPTLSGNGFSRTLIEYENE